MIKYFDILKQYVNTGKPIPEYQLQKVMGMPKGLAKSYFRARVNIINVDRRDTFKFNDYEIKYFQTLNISTQAELIKNLEKLEYLIKYSKNPDDLIGLIVDIKGDKLNTDDIKHLISHSNNPDDLTNVILSLKNKSVDYEIINLLLRYSTNKDDLINKIIGIKQDSLVISDLWSLSDWATNPDKVIKEFLKIKDISFEVPANIHTIFYLSENPKNFIDIIGKDNLYDFFKRFDVITLCNLIKDSRGPDEIIRLYVDFMGENLSEGFLYCFIKHSKNPIKIAELIGLDKFKDLFEDYDFEDKSDFENYIEYSENPSGVRKLLKILGKYK